MGNKPQDRNIFKWAGINPENADVILLFGLDTDDLVYSWCFAPDHFQGPSSTSTLTAPSSRRRGGRLDWASYPATEMLSVVIAARYFKEDAESYRRMREEERLF